MKEKSQICETLKRPRPRNYLWLSLAALLFGVMSYFFFYYPGKGIGPRQPIYFSHRVHAAVKAIDCRFCHPFVDRSQNAGLPPVEKCFFCHLYIIPQHPQIVKEHEHLLAKKPVSWIRIFFTPDYVFFHHRPHVGWHKIDCTECHGDVKSRDRLVPLNFQMGFCVGCHRERKAQLDCWLACHR
jgi:predicted CXXCH cytochrome family protein